MLVYVYFPVSADFRNAAPSEREPPWWAVVQSHHGGPGFAWGCTGKPHEDPKVRLIRSKPDARLGRPVGRRSWRRTPGAPPEPLQAQHGSRRNLGLKRQVCPLATIFLLSLRTSEGYDFEYRKKRNLTAGFLQRASTVCHTPQICLNLAKNS